MGSRKQYARPGPKPNRRVPHKRVQTPSCPSALDALARDLHGESPSYRRRHDQVITEHAVIHETSGRPLKCNLGVHHNEVSYPSYEAAEACREALRGIGAGRMSIDLCARSEDQHVHLRTRS